VNIIEALKANETKKVRCHRFGFPTEWLDWIDIGDLKNQDHPTWCVLADWQAEEKPEVVEFEYFAANRDDVIYCGQNIIYKLRDKRWRIICTEIKDWK
jgi:hypothetical protein